MNTIELPYLTLLAPLNSDARPLDNKWRVALVESAQADDESFAAPAYADTPWKTVSLPHLRYATRERNTLWYRHRVTWETPKPQSRTLLRFGGAFYETHVWLNGVALGGHEGYFQPFGFDVTEHLRPGENVLAVRCRFPVEAGAFKRKTTVTGIFADWDCKPYPSMYYPDLPEPHEWTVPLGLWQTAQLHTVGAVLVESFTVLPNVTQPDWEAMRAASADARAVLQVRNLTPAAQTAHINLALRPHNFAGDTAAQDVWDIHLDSQESRRVEFTLSLSQPRLWFPWTHGTPHLYCAALTVNDGIAPPYTLEQVFGVRAIEAQIEDERWEWRLNGRRIFPRGSNYIADFYLDKVTLAGLQRDLVLAREANLDLLRVHAHIGAPELYRQCDELGLLVICDFPLIWTYAFNLPEAEQAAFRASVRRQVEDMAVLLGAHPSISLWCLHNEPPWSPNGSFLGADVHAAKTNRQMNEAMAAHARVLDPTRPAIAASGQYDQHLYDGWYTGHWRDNRKQTPTFPTEFGVQALPNRDSPFWETVNTHWPVDVDDPTWAHAGYQSVFWINPGVGGPAQYASLADYIHESQAYQAFFIRYTIDQWRRQKFAPTGGYAHFLFTDGWPAVTWSVLDYYRLPKRGYRALAEVSRPAHVCVDLAETYTVAGAFHLVYARGDRFQADLYVVNDDYRLQGRVRLRWWLESRPGHSFRAWWQRRLAAGCSLILPRADEGARFIKRVVLPLRREGRYTFHTRLTQRGQVLDENHYDLCVGAVQSEHSSPRRVPGFLVFRVYRFGSLRRLADGFTFTLHNPTMPVFIQRVREFRVDGERIDPALIELICAGQTHSAITLSPESPLEFSTGEDLTLVIHVSLTAPGKHEFELTGQLFGLGELTARWKDTLK